MKMVNKQLIGTTPKRATNPKWPLERVLIAMAGSMTLVSVVLAVLVSHWFLLLTAFAGTNQMIYVATGDCPASVILRKFGIPAQCRW